MAADPHPTIEDVWRVARQNAPAVLSGWGISPDDYHPDDLASDLVVQFYRRGTLPRFDPRRSGLRTFVSTCMRRMVVSWLRQHGRTPRPAEPSELQADTSVVQPPEACEILLGYILNVVRDRPLGDGRTVVVDGEQYRSSVHGVLRLISRGYTYGDISRLLGVDHSYVSKIAKRECLKVRGLHEAL